MLLCALTLSVSAADRWFEEDWVESAHASAARASCEAGTRKYTFSIKLATKTHSESDDQFSAALVGANDVQTGWGSLGSNWGKDMMGKQVTKDLCLQDVGAPSALVLESDGSNGAYFESVEVTGSSLDTVYFDTSKTSVRCRYGGGNKDCDSKFAPSSAPDENGVVECKLRPSIEPITSDFVLPKGTLKLPYTGFIVYLNCEYHGAIRFEYMATDDCGSLERRGSFSLDPKVEKSCQQKNGAAYPTTQGIAFDRGHLVPANHLDADREAIYQSNYMTNILPQVAKMNRGAWLRSEEIIECLRVTENLYVLGGAVYDPSDDRYNWFEESHNVKNPSFFWKIIKAQTLHPETGHYLAIWMPNSEDALRSKISDYVVSIDQLEANLQKFGQPQTFDIPSDVKSITPEEAWPLPFGCDPQL